MGGPSLHLGCQRSLHLSLESLADPVDWLSAGTKLSLAILLPPAEQVRLATASDRGAFWHALVLDSPSLPR